MAARATLQTLLAALVGLPLLLSASALPEYAGGCRAEAFSGSQAAQAGRPATPTTPLATPLAARLTLTAQSSSLQA